MRSAFKTTTLIILASLFATTALTAYGARAEQMNGAIMRNTDGADGTGQTSANSGGGAQYRQQTPHPSTQTRPGAPPPQPPVGDPDVTVSYGRSVTPFGPLFRSEDLTSNLGVVARDCRPIEAKIARLMKTQARLMRSLAILQNKVEVSYSNGQNGDYAISLLEQDLTDVAEALARYQQELAACMGR